MTLVNFISLGKMAKKCSAENCKREVEIHCYHCSRDVCTKHYLEHKKEIQEQLPLFTDEVNLLYDRLQHSNTNPSTTIPKCLMDAREQLDK